jgi:acetyltransferase-like isoleucine patch superfamily enzyme
LGILEWVHRRETPAQRRAWELLKRVARLNVPVIPVFHHLLLAERQFRRGPLRLLWSKVYDEPLFRLQCDSVGAGLLLFENGPKIMGNLRVTLGDRVRLNGGQVWIAAGSGAPRGLEIGDDSGIGYGSELIVGESIRIGRHVMIANRVSLMGFDGHPLDPYARARNEPPGPHGVGSITIDDYAWIGSDAMILKGVTVGRGAIVGARSVVRTNVADLTVVSGNPAKVVWQVAPPEGW